MNKYRIIRWERYCKKGELKASKFYVQKKVKIFWKLTYWKYVTTDVDYAMMGGKIPERVKFTFLNEAQHFIEDVLLKGKPFDREKTTVVQTY